MRCVGIPAYGVRRIKGHNKDIDPDKHLKTTLNSSGSVYYLEDDFNRMISDNIVFPIFHCFILMLGVFVRILIL